LEPVANTPDKNPFTIEFSIRAIGEEEEKIIKSIEYNSKDKILDVTYQSTEGKPKNQEVDKNWFCLKFLTDSLKGFHVKFSFSEAATTKSKSIEYFNNVFPEFKEEEKLCIECYKSFPIEKKSEKNLYKQEFSQGIVLCNDCELKLKNRKKKVKKDKKMEKKKSQNNDLVKKSLKKALQ